MLNVGRCISFKKYHFGIPWVWFSGVFHLNLPKKFPKRKACIIKKNDQTSRQLVNTPERWFCSGDLPSPKSPEKFRFFGILSRKKIAQKSMLWWKLDFRDKHPTKTFQLQKSRPPKWGQKKHVPGTFREVWTAWQFGHPGGLFEATVLRKGQETVTMGRFGGPWFRVAGPRNINIRSCRRSLTKPSKFGSELGFFESSKSSVFGWFVGFEIRREFSGPYPPKDWNSTKETPGFSHRF